MKAGLCCRKVRNFLKALPAHSPWGLKWVERVHIPGHGGVALDLLSPELGPRVDQSLGPGMGT